jgi:hypothetical protein
MPVLIEPQQLSDVLHQEQENPRYFSREVAQIPVGQMIEIGTVLGQITASKEYVPLDPAASDGSEIAAGIAMENVDTTKVSGLINIIVKNAYVKVEGLKFDSSLTSADIETALQQLSKNGVRPINHSVAEYDLTSVMTQQTGA